MLRTRPFEPGTELFILRTDTELDQNMNKINLSVPDLNLLVNYIKIRECFKESKRPAATHLLPVKNFPFPAYFSPLTQNFHLKWIYKYLFIFSSHHLHSFLSVSVPLALHRLLKNVCLQKGMLKYLKLFLWAS